MVSELWTGMWTGMATMWGVPTASVALIMAFFLALFLALTVALFFKEHKVGIIALPILLTLETFLQFIDWVVFITIFLIMIAVYLTLKRAGISE